MEVAPHHQGKTLKYTDRKRAEIVNFWMRHVVVYGFLVSENLSEILWWLSITFWWNGKSLPSHPMSMALLAMCLQPASAKIQLVHSFTHFVILLTTLQSEVCQAYATVATVAWMILTPISTLGSPSDWFTQWEFELSPEFTPRQPITSFTFTSISRSCARINFDCHISRFTIYSLKATQWESFT